MSDLAANPAFGIEVTQANGKTDVVVAASDGTHKARQIKLLITVAPLAITGFTFLLSFGAQIWQQFSQGRATRDTEWRTALKQVSSKDSENAIQGAYEMESFLGDGQHGKQALEIASTLLPNITDKRSFDVIFFGLLNSASPTNQSQFIAVDVALTGQLKDDHYKALETFNDTKPAPADTSFANFLMHPDQFYRDDSESGMLAHVLTEAWELDTVSHGLADLWSRKTGSETLTPKGQWLNGVTFFNNDFSHVDFSTAAGMDDVHFIGACKVGSSLPPEVSVGCATPVPEATKPRD